MSNIKSNGVINGMYTHFVDNSDNLKLIFSSFLNIGIDDVKIAYRRENLELMVLVNMKSETKDSMIIFTVDRLDEYRMNYDNDNLLHLVMLDFKQGDRSRKISKIKNRLDDK